MLRHVAIRVVLELTVEAFLLFDFEFWLLVDD